jgi:hypothetical protein
MALLGSVTVDWAMFFVFMTRLSNPSQVIKESIAPHFLMHSNMLGEYDFSEKVDFQTYDLDEIFKDGAEI